MYERGRSGDAERRFAGAQMGRCNSVSVMRKASSKSRKRSPSAALGFETIVQVSVTFPYRAGVMAQGQRPREMAAAAEAALDKILDQAIEEFEEEEGLSRLRQEAAASQHLSGDKAHLPLHQELEKSMRIEAQANMDRLVENLRNPAFQETLASTFQALSGNVDGVNTIEQFMTRQSEGVRHRQHQDDDEVELDRGVAKTMNLLATEGANMEGLETAQFAASGEELMTNMIAEFEKLGQKEDFDQIVENMMRQLLARDLMYEPMKLVCDGYPAWLAEHKDSLSADEYIQFGTQYQYFQRIVAVYEREPENFARLMELLQDLQNYGQPPAELIKELAPGLEFTAEGMPIMSPGDNVYPKPGAIPGIPVDLPANYPMPDASFAQCAVA